jgi:hypothetical protein
MMLLVDAANVIGSRPNGWWRDRAGAARDFVEQVREAVRSGRLIAPVLVVLEGAARKGVAEGVVDGVAVVHAPGSGDDTLIEVAASAGSQVTLVTADRELLMRAKEVGADSASPRWLINIVQFTVK